MHNIFFFFSNHISEVNASNSLMTIVTSSFLCLPHLKAKPQRLPQGHFIRNHPSRHLAIHNP